MKHHKGHWNRGSWTRKTGLVEAADSSHLLKNSSMRNDAQDESSAWEETVPVEDRSAGWNTQTFDDSFYDDNKKIFEWDDSGAVEYLKKAEVKLPQSISLVYEDYQNEFSASIDWDTRWLCTLPDCAEELINRDEKKKIQKVSSTRRETLDNSSAVILGLPEPHDDTDFSGTPSLHLPLNFVPVPTGWGEGEDNQADTWREDSPMQPMTATNHEETQVERTSQSGWHALTNDNERLITGSGWPEQPSSYQYIIPSGWEDVEVDQPVLSSGWGGGDREPRSDIQMHQADIRWCDGQPYGSRPAWSNPLVLAESPHVYGKSHSGKPQDFYNKCHKYGWRPKRASETNTYESTGRKSMQRPGRPISTIHRVNLDSRSPRVNRSERAKAQWLTVDNITHE